MTSLSIVLIAAGVPVLAVCFYLLVLTIVARVPAHASEPSHNLVRSYVIVVPAHNEAAGLGDTLEGLERLNYPRRRWRAVVVADNCTDETAAIAHRHGAGVIVRTDTERRGKGHALEFAFQQLLAEPTTAWHAAVVVDADTVVSPNLLQACSARFDGGARAVQAAYLTWPGTGPLTTITQVALTAFHVVRSAARERLGLSCGLRGNGMAFTRALLATTPHTAYSRTEDLEFGVQLGLKGVRVAFAADATVWGEMPSTSGVVTTQRERWIGGRVEMARRYLPQLLLRAVTHASPMLADLAVDLAIPPVSALALIAFCGTALAVFMAALGEPIALFVWGGAFAALTLHVLDAALRAGRLWDLIVYTGAMPRYAIDKLLITMRAPGQFGGAWIRTARTGEVA